MRVMQAQNAGSIINVSSTLGHRSAPGASLYAASKHAVEGLTQTAALEGASFGVRVNSVSPGPTDTGMLTRFTGTPEKKAGLISGVPLNRMGTPEELAEPFCLWPHRKLHSLPERRFSSMAAKAPDDKKPQLTNS